MACRRLLCRSPLKLIGSRPLVACGNKLKNKLEETDVSKRP
jgi:hypothetical protein